MREWLLLGVIALGFILGLWLLFFKSLAALYELWQSGREFEKLKREAASHRMQRPSELMQKKKPLVVDTDPNTPEIPQALLDSLSDDQADPRLVPQKKSAAPAQQPPTATPPQIEAEPTIEPADAQPTPEPPREVPSETPASEQVDQSTTSTPPPPTFPLPPANEATPSEQPGPAPDPSQQPPRYDG